MTREPLYVEDILAALREGRIGAETAHRWIEIRLDDGSRQVRSAAGTSTTSTGEELSDEEWLRLFGSQPGHEEEPSEPVIYEAPDPRGNRQIRRGYATPNFPRYVAYSSAEPSVPRDVDIRPGTPMHSAAAAAPLTDDELYDQLFPPDYRAASGSDAG